MATEKRLIDRDKLITYFEQQYNIAMEDPDPVSGYVMAALQSCIAYFKTIHTVDAVEVVHGRWRWGKNSIGQHGAWCTKCGCGWEYKPGDYNRVQGLVNAHKYCPNCGAKMDGDRV